VSTLQFDVHPILLFKALVMGIVEGLTEFLPVSSTGHLIVVGDLLNFNSERGKVFEIVIQTGAILAVIWEYRERFRKILQGLFSDRNAQRFVINLGIAFLPAAVIGLALGKTIKAHLFKPLPVAMAFIVGAFVILWAERRAHRIRIEHVDDMTWVDALKVGCAQCVALIPGASRSGATIIGGLLFGLSRRAATEFSFFLAVPTLMAAGAYELYKERALLSAADAGWFGVGFAAAFVSAFLCVRWLLRYISSHDFTAFAWYRIVFGIVILITAYTGLVSWN
jgi:undecaprenyl-diphosphatase